VCAYEIYVKIWFIYPTVTLEQYRYQRDSFPFVLNTLISPRRYSTITVYVNEKTTDRQTDRKYKAKLKYKTDIMIYGLQR